ncbi:MAG TPA: glycosyltransferase family 4 protein [Thermoanaerobaculaceae bacterium]|nr:glycosyltransferase family 4 protein [Thermoanaerobaculaceae bacterium]
MRVLQLVAADRWTGAAATALQLAEALRAAGVECEFAFRPGRNLEQKLHGLPWCRPMLAKERSLAQVRAMVGRVRGLASGFDLVHTHLPHDHLLAKMALKGSPTPLVRSFHHAGHLRPDPYHRWLLRGTVGVGLANSAMRPAVARVPALRGAPVSVLPVALEQRFLSGGDRGRGRSRLGIPADATVAGTIGKLDRSRGHDLFLRALAATPGVHGVIIGKGPFEPALHKLARALRLERRLVFAGYVEDGLEDLYAAMDLFVFPAAGSDHAHRAIAEASACGATTLAADLPGVRDLVEPGTTGDLYPPSDAAALAVLMAAWAREPSRCRFSGQAATTRARALWTPERLSTTTLQLYAASEA